MRVIVLSLSLLLTSFFVKAQQNKPIKRETRVVVRGGDGTSTEMPLVIIDGKPGGDLQSLSPDAILKMDVLKGNSATELYGPEAKNGVVLITTKMNSAADSLPTGTKKVERIVTVNTFRKSDGGKDTTIIRSDSVTVHVDMDRIIVNGMPLEIPKGVMFKDPMPRVEGMDGKLFFFDREMDIKVDQKSAPKMGITVQETEEGKGVNVLAVVPTGAAAKAGIQKNDRVISIDEKVINDVDALKDVLQKARDKRSVMVHVQRAGKDMFIEVIFPRELKKADL